MEEEQVGKDRSQNEKSSGRVIYLDVARGITIWMVIAFHVLGETSLIYHHFAATMVMQMFLFVSGYFFHGFNVKKNLLKLFLPYTLMLVVVRIYWDIVLHTAEPGHVLDVLKQAILGYTMDELWQGNGVYVGIAWFLPMLAAARLVYFLICKIEKENEIVRGMLSVIVSCAGVVIGNQGIRLPWSLDVAMAMAFFMFLGDFAHRHREMVEAYLRKPWLLAASFLTWGVLVYCFGYSELPFRSYPNGMTCLLVSTLSMSVVLGISYLIAKYLPHITKIMSMCGRYSFVILCAHILDKSCLVHSPETNIFLLTAWELFLACIPVIAVWIWQKMKYHAVANESGADS